MSRRTKIAIGIAAGVAAMGFAGPGVASAAVPGEDDSPDIPIPGSVLTRASEAALAETGGGQVVDSEVEGEENGYEVEVNVDGGRQVEVQLDQDFAVVSSSE